MRRPCPNEGKAKVLREATGTCTLGAAGVGVQTRREGSAEITSGRAAEQQGLTATCKDLSHQAKAKGGRSAAVWRMGPYELRRRGNAFRGGARRLLHNGNAGVEQRGPGRLAVPGCFPDTEPGIRHARSRDELVGKPT